MRKIFKAFTLAEVLITLVIIGVIAAITVPTLITKYQKEQTVTRLKKAYSALAQTTARAITEHGSIETWILGTEENADAAKEFLSIYILPYLNSNGTIKTYSEKNWDMYLFSGKLWTSRINEYARFYLNDGTAIMSRIVSSSDTSKRILILVDINGDKKPNKNGRDIFMFNYYILDSDTNLNGKFLPNGFQYDREYILSNNSTGCCNKNKYGNFCSALIMKDGWRIADDYPW